MPHRQPQPRRLRRARGHDPQRRLHGRPGFGVVPVQPQGVVIVPKGELSEDDVLGAVLDAGAEEVNDLGESFEVLSEATDLVAVRTALQDAGIDYDSAEANFVPTMQVELDEEGAKKIFKLIDALEDSDDVQNVFANFDVSDEIMEKVDA